MTEPAGRLIIQMTDFHLLNFAVGMSRRHSWTSLLLFLNIFVYPAAGCQFLQQLRQKLHWNSAHFAGIIRQRRRILRIRMNLITRISRWTRGIYYSIKTSDVYLDWMGCGIGPGTLVEIGPSWNCGPNYDSSPSEAMGPPLSDVAPSDLRDPPWGRISFSRRRPGIQHGGAIWKDCYRRSGECRSHALYDRWSTADILRWWICVDSAYRWFRGFEMLMIVCRFLLERSSSFEDLGTP